MFKVKSNYWKAFSVYQTYEDKDTLFAYVDYLVVTYDLPPSVEKVLNTLKLHSQTYFGVCWLKVSEIAKKSGLSPRTVHRAIKLLKDNEVISVVNQQNTKRGGKAPNVYIINKPVISLVTSSGTSAKTPEPTRGKASTEISSEHKNTNKNTHTKKEYDITIPEDFDDYAYAPKLKEIPQEFIDIFKPYYNAEMIIKRWHTTKLACKYGATDIKYVQWETIKDAWTTTVREHKRGKIKNTKNDPLGGYYYKTLSNMALADYFDHVRECWNESV